MSEQKIDRTFNKALEEVAKLEKAFKPGGKLDKAIMDMGGDPTALNEAAETFKALSSGLTKAHFDALGQKEQLTEGVLDEDDEDGFMARSQLYFMAKDAIRLHSMIDDKDDLEPWVQSKIAQAAHAMDAVRRYTEYNAMKAQVEPEMEPAMEPEIEESKSQGDAWYIEQDARRMAEKDGHDWESMPYGRKSVYRSKAAEMRKGDDDDFDDSEEMYEDPSKPKFPIEIPLAGDSIWDDGSNPKSVTVTDYKFDKDEEDDISLHVMHDGPWTIYSDTGFEKAISEIIGHDVDFSEQGLQRDGKAHLETADTMKEGKYKNDAQRKAVHAAKNESKIEEGTEFDAAGQAAEFKAVAGDVIKNALAKAKSKVK